MTTNTNQEIDMSTTGARTIDVGRVSQVVRSAK
jgi:hypothetical protein